MMSYKTIVENVKTLTYEERVDLMSLLVCSLKNGNVSAKKSAEEKISSIERLVGSCGLWKDDDVMKYQRQLRNEERA